MRTDDATTREKLIQEIETLERDNTELRERLERAFVVRDDVDALAER